MKEIIKLINNPAEVFRNRSKGLAYVLVGISILVLSIERLIFQPTNGLLYAIYTVIVGSLLYIIDCLILYICCRALGSRTAVREYIEKWGLTFLPNILCCITVAITEHYFYWFIGNIFLTLLLNFVFVGILFWKILIFSAFLKLVAGLKGWHLLVAFAVLVIIITMLAIVHSFIGIKVPVI